MMNKKLFMVSVILLISIFMHAGSDKLRIIATIFPLYDFAKQVGKDKVDVSLMLPPGTEAHSYEPSPRDIIKIHKADFFIYISENMEVWAHDILESAMPKKLVVIEAGHDIAMVESDPDDEPGDGDHANDHHDHDDHHGKNDPHIWLDFEIDQHIVMKIAEEFSKKDKAHEAFYRTNAKNYIDRLKKLDKDYKNTIDTCSINTILYAGHFAFGHMARRYGLTHMSPYEGFTPNAEPKPADIAQIIKTVRRLNAEVIYFEELLEPRIAKIISKETGTEMLKLHGAHNLSKKELKSGITFIDIMYSNLDNLKKGLQCKN